MMARSALVRAVWIATALGLAGCSPEGKQAFQEHKEAAITNLKQAGDNAAAVANDFANTARDNVYKTSYQVQKWAATPPEPPKGPKSVSQSYCYRSLTDVLCYRTPVPGAENRLVAYQGTDAEPPPQPVTQLLPTRPFDASQSPVNRIATVRPVFVGLPPEEKTPAMPTEAKPLALGEIPPKLPNPLLSPHL